MTYLTGVYACKIDNKGRLMLPSFIKKSLLPVLDEGFVIKQSVYKNCLELFPMETWKKEMLKLENLDVFQKETDQFIRIFLAGHRQVELDKVGRLRLSKELLEYASIEKEVIVASAVNKMEIWSKQNYEKEVGDKSIDFGALAKSVMPKTK